MYSQVIELMLLHSSKGKMLTLLFNTRGTRRVLSERAFKHIPESCEPKLTKSNTLASADGKFKQEL